MNGMNMDKTITGPRLDFDLSRSSVFIGGQKSLLLIGFLTSGPEKIGD